MYFQFLIEDKSTAVLIEQIMIRVHERYPEKEIYYDSKSFSGIGGLRKTGKPIDQKTGKLLNDLPLYFKAFNRRLSFMDDAALFIVLDNDKRDPAQFYKKLQEIAVNNRITVDYVYCIAVKEMEAWLLGDMEAVKKAYPDARISAWRKYEQDAICPTWEILADAVYPGGYKQLRKKAGGGYDEIGKMKGEWAEKIGGMLDFDKNLSPSFQKFWSELRVRIERI